LGFFKDAGGFIRFVGTDKGLKGFSVSALDSLAMTMEEWRIGGYGTLFRLPSQTIFSKRPTRHLANPRIIHHILQSSIGLKEILIPHEPPGIKLKNPPNPKTNKIDYSVYLI